MMILHPSKDVMKSGNKKRQLENQPPLFVLYSAKKKSAQKIICSEKLSARISSIFGLMTF
jgi:hypothetical protein